MNRSRIFSAVAVATFPFAAAAQEVVDAGRLSLEGWSYEPLYAEGVWSVDEMMGADVYGPGAEIIGDVEDVVLNAEGEVVSIIAEVGGFIDIGDTHVSIPWEDVTIAPGGLIQVPLTEETVDDYDLFATATPATALEEQAVAGVDDEVLYGDYWRASDLIGDYARIMDDASDWTNYGYVNDILIKDGRIAATVVNTTPAYGPGTYAYPYVHRRALAPGDPRVIDDPAGYWNPGSPYYDLPVLVGDASELQRFEPDRVNPG